MATLSSYQSWPIRLYSMILFVLYDYVLLYDLVHKLFPPLRSSSQWYCWLPVRARKRSCGKCYILHLALMQVRGTCCVTRGKRLLIWAKKKDGERENLRSPLLNTLFMNYHRSKLSQEVALQSFRSSLEVRYILLEQ